MSVALITGTTKGLGYALANLYLENGSKVIGVSRHKPKIDSEYYYHLVDSVTNDEIEIKFKDFLDTLNLKKIDVIINNAGTGSYGSRLSQIETTEIINQVNLHCVGVLRVLKGAKSYLGNTKIVNITSRLGSIVSAKLTT